jgi:hypothetical protein
MIYIEYLNIHIGYLNKNFVDKGLHKTRDKISFLNFFFGGTLKKIVRIQTPNREILTDPLLHI